MSSNLVLRQLVLGQATDSLHLTTREHGAGGTRAGLVALGDDGLLHGFLAHSHALLHLHRLHGLLHLHGGGLRRKNSSKLINELKQSMSEKRLKLF